MSSRVFFGVFVSLCVLLTSCQPPVESDSAADARALIVGPTWMTEAAYQGIDPADVIVTFYASGVAKFSTGMGNGSWSYTGTIFTVSGPFGVFSTTSPFLNHDHFWFNYNGGLCHLTRDRT